MSQKENKNKEGTLCTNAKWCHEHRETKREIGSHVLLTNGKDHGETTVTENMKSRQPQQVRNERQNKIHCTLKNITAEITTCAERGEKKHKR